MTCRGICTRYRFKKDAFSRQVYSDGASRCQTCTIFIKWDGMNCPCCGMKLRKTPRNKQGKEAMRIRNKTRMDDVEEEPLIKVIR